MNESKWITFNEVQVPPKRKTREWQILTKERNHCLGYIRWYGAWRCYAFFPKSDAELVFEKTCLRDIASFSEQQTDEHKHKPKPDTTLAEALVHRPLLIVALHGDQLDLFRRSHGLSPNIIRRVRNDHDTHGHNPDLVLIVLPDAGNTPATLGAIRTWQATKGRCCFITESELTNTQKESA